MLAGAKNFRNPEGQKIRHLFARNISTEGIVVKENATQTPKEGAVQKCLGFHALRKGLRIQMENHDLAQRTRSRRLNRRMLARGGAVNALN